MTNLKKVYIDVTQSFSWKGRATGIIRVMDEVSVRFVGDKRFDVEFVVWDEHKECFYSIDYVQALQNRVVEDDEFENQNDTPAASKSVGLIKKARRVASKTPLLGHSYRFMRLLKDKAIVRMSARPIRKVQLEENATLFMPHGGVWESKKYSKYILNLQSAADIALIPIVYDLCPVLTPQFCSKGVRKIFSRHMRETLSKSDHVLAISQNTLSDIERWLGDLGQSIPEISVFRLGDEIGGERSSKPSMKLPSQYLLCVGTIEARKNHTVLYYVYKLAAQRGIEIPPVVIVGRKGWLAQDIYEIIQTDPDIKNKFIFLHKQSDQELAWLYENSLFSVYPTFYEGWGLPVAESLLRGRPVISSGTSSLPEIAGDLVEYCSPYSPDDFLQKITKLSSDQKNLEVLASRIKKTYKPTTWDETYRQVSGIISRI